MAGRNAGGPRLRAGATLNNTPHASGDTPDLTATELAATVERLAERVERLELELAGRRDEPARIDGRRRAARAGSVVGLYCSTASGCWAVRRGDATEEERPIRHGIHRRGQGRSGRRQDDGAARTPVAESTATASEHWDERPVPLGPARAPAPFPTDTLPGWAAEFVDAVAVATQTPPDLAGVLVLCAFATAAGGRAVVEVRPGWREPLNLFAAVAMPPGARKSPVFVRVTRPLATSERAAIDAAGPEILEARTRREAADRAADQAQLRAGHATDTDKEAAIREAMDARMMAEAVTVPTMPRLLADDATPEALTSLIAEQGGRLAVLSDEGDVFDVMAGRYSKSSSPNLGVYLKGHAGSPMRVDRKGRSPEHIEAPALTLGLAVQPEVLQSIADRPGFRGRGLLARFLWSLPASNVGHRLIGAPPVPDPIGAEYDNQIEVLVHSLAEWTDPAVIPFTTEANEILLEFEERLEPLMRPAGELAHVADWASKLAGTTARLAGLLHLAGNVTTGWSRPVEARTMTNAVRLGDYFTAHALAVFDFMAADPELARARLIAGWCRNRETFTRRDAHRAHQSAFPRATDLDPVLSLLEAHMIIRRLSDPERGPNGGRPPAPTYSVNPEWR